MMWPWRGSWGWSAATPGAPPKPVGLSLLVRSATGTRPTAAGSVLDEHARRILDLARELCGDHGAARAASAARDCVFRPERAGEGCGGQRQDESEPGSSLRGARGAQVAALGPDKVARDGEPEARAGVTVGPGA